MNYYPHHIGDYARDTAHLSMLEDAAYRRMLDLYYASERILPKNRDGLYRLVRARSTAEKLAVDVVLGEFFQETEAGWRNARADIEIGRAQEKSSKAKASAHASVEARQRTGKEVRAQRMAAAKEKGTHTNEEWLLLVELCGKKCVKCGADSPLDRDHVLPVYKGGSDAITNLQPLCAPCNSSKGPEAFDYVPPEIRSAFAQRSLNEGSTPNSQEPKANNQEPKKKSNGEGRAAALPGWLPVDAWQGWLEVRKKNRAPNTARALELAVGVLEKLKDAGNDPREVLEKSTLRGWRGLFPLDDSRRPKEIDFDALAKKLDGGASAAH